MTDTIDYSVQIAAASPSDTPVIFTALGNIPEGALQYETSWDVSESSVVFKEQWSLNGEIVKSNAHAYAINAFTIGTIGGI